jgi:hypothetical protein
MRKSVTIVSFVTIVTCVMVNQGKILREKRGKYIKISETLKAFEESENQSSHDTNNNKNQ